ncbi:MAG TPA: OsmC family protein [Flavipsychrobacter sp.]|nr:OsmC family protein [Flavipsychrobacter sp.]
MVTITIQYDIASNTFTAKDELGNAANFQTVPDGRKRPVLEAVSRNMRPMQALLLALGTCSGIDMVMILGKQREAFQSFEMVITGEREEGVVPALWKAAHILFRFTGDVSMEKAERAAALSINKYCSVAETLRRADCTITYNVQIN